MDTLISPNSLNATLNYIDNTWSVLTRSHKHILAAVQDEKAQHTPGTKWPLYISQKESKENVEKLLASELTAEQYNQIEVVQLENAADGKSLSFPKEHGLLYLPKPYIVPGGRFNEVINFRNSNRILSIL